MANARELLDRRRSAQNTRKMTRTMELVAGAKLKQVQLVAERFRPYAEGLHRLLHNLALASDALDHPLLAPRTPWRCAVFVVTSHRGLCGAFNANLVRWGVEVIEEHLMMGRDVEVVSVGRKGGAMLRAHGIMPDREYREVMLSPTVDIAEEIIAEYTARVERNELDRIDVVYSRVEGLSAARPANLVLVPVGGYTRSQLAIMATQHPQGFIYHPPPSAMLQQLVPRMARIDFYSCLLQTVVSAHGARRMAMKNATSSADDLIKLLSRQYNRARQTRITREIAEIVGAVEAMA